MKKGLWGGERTRARRREEAEELLNQLDGHQNEMNDREAEFVEDMLERFEEYGDRTLVSEKQIYWLRDLTEKYT